MLSEIIHSFEQMNIAQRIEEHTNHVRKLIANNESSNVEDILKYYGRLPEIMVYSDTYTVPTGSIFVGCFRVMEARAMYEMMLIHRISLIVIRTAMEGVTHAHIYFGQTINNLMWRYIIVFYKPNRNLTWTTY